MATEIVLRHSKRQALQIPCARVVDEPITDEWKLILFGKPRNLIDNEYLFIEFINQGENSIDYRVYTDLACDEKGLLENSRMRLEAEDSIAGGEDPTTNSALVTIASQPAHIKVYVKATNTGETSKVDVAAKGRG